MHRQWNVFTVRLVSSFMWQTAHQLVIIKKHMVGDQLSVPGTKKTSVLCTSVFLCLWPWKQSVSQSGGHWAGWPGRSRCGCTAPRPLEYLEKQAGVFRCSSSWQPSLKCSFARWRTCLWLGVSGKRSQPVDGVDDKVLLEGEVSEAHGLGAVDDKDDVQGSAAFLTVWTLKHIRSLILI